jgi:MYXO-CTERM domain-containing protein
MADIDGDGHVEALVGHDDGTLYAVNLSPAEGTPSLAWSAYLGSPVNSVRVLDADGDGTLEVLVLANDGTARLLDGGDTVVSIDTPIDGACSSDESLVLSGTAEGVDQVEVFLQGISQGRVPVTDGAWTLTLPWPSEGSFRVEVWAVLDDELVASDTITVTFYDDADGDGVSECDSDCDDANADRYPGAEEICDGVDSDCDGTVSDEADDDGDGYLACEECDDADATALPGGVEVCDDLDNDCDGDVDEDDVCDQTSYFRGGGGCGCASTTGDSPAAGIALAALALGLARRRRARS